MRGKTVPSYLCSGNCGGCPAKTGEEPKPTDETPTTEAPTEEKAWPATNLPLLTSRTIDIFENISQGTLHRVTRELDELLEDGDDPILVRINTHGGYTHVGLGIHELLVNAGPLIVTAVMGNAYSAGSVILQAGDHRIVTPHSAVMIHQEWSFVAAPFNVEDAEKFARERRWSEDRMERLYVVRTGRTAEEIRAWCAKDRWMLATDAIELGFADAIFMPRDTEAHPGRPSIVRKAKRRIAKMLIGINKLARLADLLQAIGLASEDDEDDDLESRVTKAVTRARR